MGRTKEKALELWQLCPFLSKGGATDVAGHVLGVSCGRESDSERMQRGERARDMPRVASCKAFTDALILIGSPS